MEHKVTISVLIDPNEYSNANNDEDGAIKVALEILRKRANWPRKLVRIQCGNRYLYADYNLRIEKEDVHVFIQPTQEVTNPNRTDYEAEAQLWAAFLIVKAKDAEISRLKKELQEVKGSLQGTLDEVRAALKICRSR